MDYNALLQAVGSVGFPVVMCFTLIWYQKNTVDMLKASIDNLADMVNDLKNKLENFK